jgi:hypothetical protein
MPMDLSTIEANVEALDTSAGFDFVYDLLTAYGFPKATIALLKNGTGVRAPSERERLLKNKLYYRFLEEWETNEDIHAVIDDAASDDAITKQKPRFLIVRDKNTLVAMDRSTGETLDVPLEKLHLHASFFLPWAGIEKVDLETAHYADVKAAEKMARLYDEIRKVNDTTGDEEAHALNVFFSRLLFCFFAEDTGIFEPGQVTKAVGSLTMQDGSDLHTFLDQLFEVLDTPERDRGDLPSYLRDFGYVNGSLFTHRTKMPQFSAKARKIIIECSELDWSEINPDIFGSMMQAVVHVDQRAGLGMHYTSVENIMKVLRPLFLDELDEAYEASEDDAKKLRKLHDRISTIKVFDPACGSGNFLVIAYKELRKLEHRILERLRELEADPKGSGLFEESRISLANFYGIEIDDFAHEIAKLSLWLAKHQTNKRFEELFGSRLQMIPLTESGHITCANATRADWRVECVASSGDEIYVCGNPPYLGSSMQSPEQKADIAAYFEDENFSPNLDYVSMWFLKGADLARTTGAVIGLVSTNSICQGNHVGLLFPKLFARGVEIVFAHQSFRWVNSARGGAGVTCIVLGLASGSRRDKWLYRDGTRQAVEHITPYLNPNTKDTIVVPRSMPPQGLPEMLFGSKATDGGNLNLTRFEMETLVGAFPKAERWMKRYVGADEFIKGEDRYCMWVEANEAAEALQISPIRERVAAVRDFRLRSKKAATRELAGESFRFAEVRYKDSPAIIVPRHSSERREYVPMGFLDAGTVISDAANAIYDATPWVFGLVQSRMHMAWLRAVGGRLKTDYRYSAVLVYNTFPVPDLSDEGKDRLSEAAFGVLGARQQFPDRTLAELYDPDKMPAVLLNAHHELDDVVDRIYSPTAFVSDDERLAKLFEMYEDLTSKQEKLNA